jgi:hypothetical protein
MHWRQAVFLVFLLSACASSSPVQESAKGMVFLEPIPVRQFQATHPIQLDSALIARSLQGVMVHEENGLQSVTNQTIPAFSSDDIAFLAPAIASRLGEAASDQQVGFRILQRGGVGSGKNGGDGIESSEPPLSHPPEVRTTGRLFVFGRSLYLTLHQFRDRPGDQPDGINVQDRGRSEPNGLRDRTIFFVPEMVLRPDIYAPAFSVGEGFTTLVIDYNLLAKLPARSFSQQASSRPSPAQSTVLQTGSASAEAAPPMKGDLQQIRDEMKQSVTEVEELRKELRELKRRLGSEGTDSSETPSKKSLPARSGNRQP